MKRRNFLKNIGRVSAAPMVLNGLPVSSFATTSMLPLFNCQGVEDRILVLLFLKGGNDGINTLVPIEQYDTYINLRPGIGLADSGANGIISLDATLSLEDQIGLHPAMTGFKDMYDAGKAALVQGVGYPSYNQSHFKSTDLWLSGGDGTPDYSDLASGWMGRYLETAFPGISGNPSPDFPDPLGIQLGDVKPSLGFHNHFEEYVASNLTNQNPADLYGLLNGIGTAPHTTIKNTDFFDAVQYIMDVENSTNAYGQRITEVYNLGTNSGIDYPSSGLANQLRMVARLINGGSKTKIFLVHKTGFDTHANQVQAGESHVGKHANLLADIFNSIQAFHQDLEQMGLSDRVLTATFSEFGRRAKENGSTGTDHGTLAPMFLFGNGVQAGVHGTNVDLSNLSNSGNLLQGPQYDYRSVYKTLLQDWLGADSTVLEGTQVDPFDKIPDMINPDALVSQDCYLAPLNSAPVDLSPVQGTFQEEAGAVTLQWSIPGGQDNDHFLVERSQNGYQFETIATLKGGGNYFMTSHFDFTDPEPLDGASYYRITSVGLRGTGISRSEPIEIDGPAPAVRHLRIYPNPANMEFNLAATVEKADRGEIQIYNYAGQRVLIKAIYLQEGFNKFPISVGHLTPGTYLVRLVNTRKLLATKPLQIVR